MARKKIEGTPPMPTTAEKLRAVRLELPEDIHKLLRLEAAKEDKSLGDLARQFVTEALTRKKGGAK
jgi:plasmid stability protein